MGLWCKDLPFVDVPQSATPKRVTIAMPYYENARFLLRQLGWWETYPGHLLDVLSFIVVDDGSPDYPIDLAMTWFRGVHPPSLRLFRIERDVRWNWLAARNIAAHHAADGWLLLTDIDHVIPASTAEAIIYGQHDPELIYCFSRIEHTGQPITPHSASFLMTRAMFWTIGGYDEALSGFYGTDGDWRRRCAAVAPLVVLRDRLVRHEYQEDSSTTRYARKQPEDAAVKRIIARRGKGWRPKTLSFAYHEVPLSRTLTEAARANSAAIRSVLGIALAGGSSL